jgi:glyoxylase-like metal-dependent hydrolase (beta-lactamase superfamily II)
MLIPAGNASEWTGPTGTNTWLIAGREPALVDAGVGNPEHIDAIASALAGMPLARILITHGHRDHSGGLSALRARWPRVEVISGAPLDVAGAIAADGMPIAAGDGSLRAMATPGHSPDHFCFFDEDSGDLYCGDLMRQGGTVVIPASKGGNLRDYLASLARVRALSPRRLLPGHGKIVDDPAGLIDAYVAHRAERDAQILAAYNGGACTPEAIVDRVYPRLSPQLRAAAADSVAAHLVKLRAEGRL